MKNQGKSPLSGSSWSNISGLLHCLMISDHRWNYPGEASCKSRRLWFSLFPCCVMMENCRWCFQKP